MSTYWVLTQKKLNRNQKSARRLLGLDLDARFNSDTLVGDLTDKQAERLLDEDWVLWVEKDAGTLKSLTDEDEEARVDRKAFVRTLVVNGRAAIPEKDGSLPDGDASHAIIGFEADGTAIVTRRRFH